MVERSCVYKFIAKSQRNFQDGKTLLEVLSKVGSYQKAVRIVYGEHSFFERPAHRVGTSRLGLSGLAVYEFVRFKGIPLPNSNDVIDRLLFLRDFRRAICNGKKPQVDRQELIDF